MTIDLALMLRNGWIKDGQRGSGTLHWTANGESRSSVSHSYNLIFADDAEIRLSWRARGGDGEWIDRKQTIRLTYTQPRFGGRRWWMVCPVRGNRIGKLYLPNGGDIFAGREAWGITYRSQRQAERDRVFERLYKVQAKLKCREGWEEPIKRPKGMWRRTYERLEAEYWELDARCSMEMTSAFDALRASFGALK
ncbi:hypothetical protein [Novosphingobium sp. TH158]|uniref:hypothetical protein n=1 Tax=Novosphingobium sp. TH158 TaxID=2067455 RepID=UPI0011818FA9|nr:hypothetical protein [Novosphingobium sp. TH158]